MAKRVYMSVAAVACVAAIAVVGIVLAQRPEEPLPSPGASVSQMIGTGFVTVMYHRPGVKGRVIWGELVPHDELWRAGANGVTQIKFDDDVLIEGQKLAAGEYGFYILPNPDEWVLVFSTVSQGQPQYPGEEKDALRVTIGPAEAPMKERLQYGFEDVKDWSAVGYLHWEKKKGSFKIEVADKG